MPIDPSSDVPPGYTADQRGVPGGFAGDPDIMDTWATSSLTPQIACGWDTDPELWSLTFPMDFAPEAHDIIRTWVFSRVVRACSVLVDGAAAHETDLARPLAGPVQVELLPPFAGGAVDGVLVVHPADTGRACAVHHASVSRDVGWTVE